MSNYQRFLAPFQQQNFAWPNFGISIFHKKPHESWKNEKSKKKLIVLGCGWGGYSFIRKINRKLYDVIVVSPRNHFLFTPLLASTTVGTLEFRCITEPGRHIKNLEYHQAKCIGVNPEKNSVTVRDTFDSENIYDLTYDSLIYAVGSQANDFGIQGVTEHTFFLKQLKDAQKIRERLQELFERAAKPNVSRSEREKLLSIVIVGGGPTSIEFAAELHDWLNEDAIKMFPQLIDQVSISLIEATNRILSAFGKDLADYTQTVFRKRKIKVMTNSIVVNVTNEYVELKDGYKIGYGMVVWATGNMSVPLTQKIQWVKTKGDRIIIDAHCRVPNERNIYVIGDCAEFLERPLPPTAQVAKQQGTYLAVMFNSLLSKPTSEWNEARQNYSTSFSYSHRGMMAYVGGWQGVVEGPQTKGSKKTCWTPSRTKSMVILAKCILYHVTIRSQSIFGANVLVQIMDVWKRFHTILREKPE